MSLVPFSRRLRTRSATLIEHNGHKGHKGKPTSLILVSFVSFVLIQRRYTEAKTDLLSDLRARPHLWLTAFVDGERLAGRLQHLE